MKKIFAYPKEYVTLPLYTAHAGQEVEVVRELLDGKEYDGPSCDCERMFLIRAADGWEGHAFESELITKRGKRHAR